MVREPHCTSAPCLSLHVRGTRSPPAQQEAPHNQRFADCVRGHEASSRHAPEILAYTLVPDNGETSGTPSHAERGTRPLASARSRETTAPCADSRSSGPE